MGEDKKFYKIGEMSKLCSIPVRTLHHYDDIDLLKPAKVDSESNYRYYSHDQLMEISIIKYFKTAGFSLNEIKKLVKREDLKFSREMIMNKTLELDREILKLTALKNKLNIYVEGMKESDGEESSFEICIKDIPLSYVAYSRYTGPCNPEEFYLRFTKLNNKIEKNKFNVTGSMMAVYHDDYREFDYTNADIEVCTIVTETEEKQGDVREFGGFLAAVAHHYGTYETMSQTYGKMLEWLGKNNMVFLGGAIENYIIDAVTSTSPDEYITELILPVKKLA